MAASKKPPVIMLPRMRWVWWIGPWLARVLPARKHTGVVLSYDEFRPLREEWEESWKKASAGDLSEEDFKPLVIRFLKAQRLPVRPIMSLPGSILTEVLEDLFICQSRGNLPAQMVDVMEREIRKRRTGKASPTRARKTRPRRSRSMPS